MREDDEGRWKPWIACPDLTNAHALPTVDGHNAGWGVWSPDGNRIAFNADYADPDVGDTDRHHSWLGAPVAAPWNRPTTGHRWF
jgi:hypothetical protein